MNGNLSNACFDFLNTTNTSLILVLNGAMSGLTDSFLNSVIKNSR